MPPLWRESRVPAERLALQVDPVWRGDGVPQGDGATVLLIAGFLAGDPSLGYDLSGNVYIAGIDANSSFTTGVIAISKSTDGFSSNSILPHSRGRRLCHTALVRLSLRQPNFFHQVLKSRLWS